MMIGYYLRRARKMPPGMLVREAAKKCGVAIKNLFAELKARLTCTQISDESFVHSLKGFSILGEYLKHIRTRQRPHFFICPSEKEYIIQMLGQWFPNNEKLLIAKADKVCAHIFDLLGSWDVNLNEVKAQHPASDEVGCLPWHCDFKSGHSWNPKTFYKRIRRAPYPGGYDIKVPWELSRCQHFAWLGQAYWFTGDEKYAREFSAHVLDWIEQNPPQFGVNWACTMDVAIRAVNWLWGYYYFKHSPCLNDEFLLAFLKSLLAHGQHIMKNLEWSKTLTSNHYLSNIVGLIYLGILLPEYKEARNWREFGLGELEREMFKQVYPDGMDFEASVSYHRLTTELFLSAVLLAHLNGYMFSDSFMSRLEKMFEFTMYISKPDGTVPLIGDNDNGRIHRLKVWEEPDREWIDHRYLLAIGAVLFEREDFAKEAGDQWEEAIWLFGEKASAFRKKTEAKELLQIQLESRAFPDAGLYIMRNDQLYMIVDAGPNGQNGVGGHAHNDTLSFELFADGRSWIVDPGTYAYTADFAARNLFRSTSSHNTVKIDDSEINMFDIHSLFRLSSEASSQILCWETTEDSDLLIAQHYGYERLEAPVVHKRSVSFNKVDKFWIVIDSFSGEGQHNVEWNFHLGHGIKVETDQHIQFVKVLRATDTSAQLLILPLFEVSDCSLRESWLSTCYGRRMASSSLHYQLSVDVPATFAFGLYPRMKPDTQNSSYVLEKVRKEWFALNAILGQV